MTTRLDEVSVLASQIKDTVGTSNSSSDRSAKRALFGAYAKHWNDAEEAGEKEALEELRQLRPKLRMQRCNAANSHSMVDKLSMLLRLMLTVFVAGAGCACLLALTPLRWMHPLLRPLGVPNGLLPMDICMYFWGRSVMAAAGVKVKIIGQPASQQWENSQCGVLVYNHASNLDPFIVNIIARTLAPKYIGKKILFAFPFFGWFSLAVGMVPINRGDREKAVHTMNETVGGIMRRWGRSVAVSPEGTRSTDGHLMLPFKKGAFHLQEQTKAPLLPVVIFGAFDLWPPGQLFATPGEVTGCVLPPQPAATAHNSDQGNAREASRLALQRAMASRLAQHPEQAAAQPLSWTALMEHLTILACDFAIFWQFGRLYSGLAAAAGLGTMGVCSLLVVTTVFVAVAVDQLM